MYFRLINTHFNCDIDYWKYAIFSQPAGFPLVVVIASGTYYLSYHSFLLSFLQVFWKFDVFSPSMKTCAQYFRSLHNPAPVMTENLLEGIFWGRQNGWTRAWVLVWRKQTWRRHHLVVFQVCKLYYRYLGATTKNPMHNGTITSREKLLYDQAHFVPTPWLN